MSSERHVSTIGGLARSCAAVRGFWLQPLRDRRARQTDSETDSQEAFQVILSYLHINFCRRRHPLSRPHVAEGRDCFPPAQDRSHTLPPSAEIPICDGTVTDSRIPGSRLPCVRPHSGRSCRQAGPMHPRQNPTTPSAAQGPGGPAAGFPGFYAHAPPPIPPFLYPMRLASFCTSCMVIGKFRWSLFSTILP